MLEESHFILRMRETAKNERMFSFSKSKHFPVRPGRRLMVGEVEEEKEVVVVVCFGGGQY